jgi:hypothetical protein
MITPAFNLTSTERILPRLLLDWTTGVAQSGVDVIRAGVATFVGSNGLIQSASADTQRIDYSFGTAGLLIEESRTNLLTYSDDFSNVAWIKSNASISTDVIDAPDGTTTTDKLVENTANSAHSIRRDGTSITSGQAYTFSIYAQAAERSIIGITFSTSVFGTQGAIFNLSAGTAATFQGSPTIKIIPVGGGWYRCIYTAVATATTTANFTPQVALRDGAGNSIYLGDGSSGVYLWGAQLEAGAFPTSYIPTEATAVTRNPDVATMTGTNFSDWFNAGAGGVVARVLPSTVSGTRPALQFDDATADEVITLRGNTTNPELVIVDGGSPQAQIDAGTIAANTAYNLSAAWNTDNCAAAVNGGTAATDTTATIPTVTQARLGSDGTNYLNGHLQTVRYWPQRIINAEVQAFSK